jgi:hypothetical protein
MPRDFPAEDGCSACRANENTAGPTRFGPSQASSDESEVGKMIRTRHSSEQKLALVPDSLRPDPESARISPANR